MTRTRHSAISAAVLQPGASTVGRVSDGSSGGGARSNPTRVRRSIPKGGSPAGIWGCAYRFILYKSAVKSRRWRNADQEESNHETLPQSEHAAPPAAGLRPERRPVRPNPDGRRAGTPLYPPHPHRTAGPAQLHGGNALLHIGDPFPTVRPAGRTAAPDGAGSALTGQGADF